MRSKDQRNVFVAVIAALIGGGYYLHTLAQDKLRRELEIGNTMVSGVTVTGNFVMGTAGYLAPEVSRGEDATPAADVYSLGVSFFRLLTGVWYGESPNIWQLLDPFADAWREVLQAMLAEDPALRPVPLAPVAAKIAAACEVESRGEVEASPRPRLSRFRLLVASVAAALVIGCGAFAAWWFFHDDEIRLDDLYSIPSAAPEN